MTTGEGRPTDGTIGIRMPEGRSDLFHKDLRLV